MNAPRLTAAAAARSRSSSCPSSPLQQQKSRLCTPPTSGRSTPIPPLTMPPLALPRAAAALAALSIEVPTATTTEAPRESAAAPPSTSRVAAPPKDPIEAENEALAEFVSWLIANGKDWRAQRARERDRESAGRKESRQQIQFPLQFSRRLSFFFILTHFFPPFFKKNCSNLHSCKKNKTKTNRCLRPQRARRPRRHLRRARRDQQRKQRKQWKQRRPFSGLLERCRGL